MHNLLAAIVCFVFAIILTVMLNDSFDREMTFTETRLEQSLSKEDRERVIANLRGEYK